MSSALVSPEDKEELALTLNGRKRKIRKDAFLAAFKRAKLDEKVAGRLFGKFENYFPAWSEFIDISFLPEAMKLEYKEIIRSRAKQLGLKALYKW